MAADLRVKWYDTDIARYIIETNQRPFVNLRRPGTAGVTTLVFDGKKYVKDSTFTTMDIVEEGIERFVGQERQRISQMEEGEDKVKLNKALNTLEGHLKGCKVLPSFTALVDKMSTKQVEFDSDYSVINFDNGIYDLYEHKLREHDPSLYTTMIAPTAVDPEAKAPEAWALLNHMFDVREGDESEENRENVETRDYFLDVLGSSLLRKRSEEKFFILHGVTANNGKTTIMQAFAEALGVDGNGYAALLDSSTFSVKRTKNATLPEFEMAVNKCIGAIDEPSRDEQDASALKSAANMGRVTFRTLYDATKSKRWTATLIHLCNPLPIIDLRDAGAMRRVAVIPIKSQISEAMKNAPRRYEKCRDEKYGTYLAANEGPGLINILLTYLKRYQARGYRLPPMPKKIGEATENYILKQNTVKRFLNERCSVDPEPYDKNMTRPCVNGKRLHDAFRKYCVEELGIEHPMQPNNIIEAMEGLKHWYGVINDKRTNYRAMRGYDGVRLLDETELGGTQLKLLDLDEKVDLEVHKALSTITVELCREHPPWATMPNDALAETIFGEILAYPHRFYRTPVLFTDPVKAKISEQLKILPDVVKTVRASGKLGPTSEPKSA